MFFEGREISSETTKDKVAGVIDDSLKFEVVDRDLRRPWGGFWVINEAQVSKFLDEFFPGLLNPEEAETGKLSPKLLLVAPNNRLSWQIHSFRSEHWKVLDGPVGALLSDTNEPKNPVQTFSAGDLISVPQGMRHRLIGLKNWGLVAEVWQHTDPSNPSSEDDIVRLEDDFGR